MIAGLIVFEAVAFSVMHHIQPMPSPALAVMRRSQEAIDHLFIGIRRLVINERLHFFRFRRQASEIIAEPAN